MKVPEKLSMIHQNENNPSFSEEAAQELQSLAEQWQHLIQESESWFNKYAQPLFSQCKNMDEWRKVRNSMPSPVDEGNQTLDFPGSIPVCLAYSADAVYQINS